MWKQLKREILTKLVGWRVISEPKWKQLPTEKFSNYLYDNHPDRHWYVHYLLESHFQKIAEIGAGAMWEIRDLKKTGKLSTLDYTVIDIAKNFMAEGEKLFPEVKFVVGDIQKKLSLPDETFDVTYCRSVLEHQAYYTRPLQELSRLSANQVVVNLFRWSLDKDRIERGKYWSNSYDIHKFLDFMNSLFPHVDHFIVYRDDGGIPNLYDDQNVRRTGDHLVVIGHKKKEGTSSPYKTLDTLKIKYRKNPFVAGNA